MTRKEALTELLAKVEAGWPPDIDTPYMRPFIAAFGANWIAGHANDANRGSLDAAKALHDAVLPGWWWTKPDGPESGTIRVVGPDNGDCYPSSIGKHEDPARAWLIAIIKAMIAGRDT